MKIYIDSGHRNNNLDFGATGSDGTKESVLALQIGSKLKRELEALGHTTYMSRTSENQSISLAGRVKKANDLKVDLYLSIHINAASNTSAIGFECLCYPSDKNRVVSTKIAKEVTQLTGQKNRGSKDRDDLYVLNATNMCSYLLECGFISNVNEREQMKKSDFQDKVVLGTLRGLGLEPKQEDKPINPPSTQTPKDKTLMIIDGVETYVESILVDGNNYIKLRDLDTTNIDVMYDSIKKCAIITTKGHKEVEEQGKKLLGENWELTAYCSCLKCNGRWTGYPAKNGEPLKEGYTIAVDPSIIPLNTWVYIEGIGERKACDVGGAIKGNRIDILFETHEQALAFGRKKGVKVYKINK